MPADRSPSIAVIRAGALGDVILTLPALQALGVRYPGAAIRVVGYPALWEVAGPHGSDISSIDSPLFSGLFSVTPSPALRGWLEGVDMAIAWTVRDPSPALRAGGVSRIVHSSPHPPPGVHAADWLLQSVSAGPHGPAVPTVHLSAGEMKEGAAVLGRMGLERPVVMHPGAGAGWKRWPAERFARVAEELVRGGYRVALVEGPADPAATAEVQRHVPTPLPVIRGLPVRTLAAVLAQSHLFLGNDSGVTHLAAAAGARVIALFGPTDPASWAPRGDVCLLRACERSATAQGRLRVCEDPGCMEGLSVKYVLRATEDA